MKKNKIIKLTEEQFKQIINEDYPFDYKGSESPKVNHGSEITGEGPHIIDAPDVNVTPMTSDNYEKEITNGSWWNRKYGFKC
jgi:hypothetical protein